MVVAGAIDCFNLSYQRGIIFYNQSPSSGYAACAAHSVWHDDIAMSFCQISSLSREMRSKYRFLLIWRGSSLMLVWFIVRNRRMQRVGTPLRYSGRVDHPCSDRHFLPHWPGLLIKIDGPSKHRWPRSSFGESAGRIWKYWGLRTGPHGPGSKLLFFGCI